MTPAPAQTRRQGDRPTGPDPVRPIITYPWEFAITGFHDHADPDGSEPHIDLSLHRGAEPRRLRFWSPGNPKIEEGFPCRTQGKAILDVRRSQLAGTGVSVTDFVSGANWGAVTIWAHSVIDLGATGAG